MSGPAASHPSRQQAAEPRPHSPLLSLRNLHVRVAHTERESVTIVRGIDLTLYEGRTTALVGESGSGKSVTALALLQLLQTPPFEISADQLTLAHGGQNIDLRTANTALLRQVRGGKIGMISQDSMASLNPVLTIGEQILEPLHLHTELRSADAKRRAIELLDEVRIPSPAKQLARYPHQLSGGMRQRVMIAAALAANPAVLIADEPTTALDVTVQAQVLALLADLQKRRNLSILLITHDLGVVAQVAHDIAVMYAGTIVERGEAREVLLRPNHPYTRALLDCVPDIDQRTDRRTGIRGNVPTPAEVPAGCPFHPRCELARAAAGNRTDLIEAEVLGENAECSIARIPAACAGSGDSGRPRLVPVGTNHDSACPEAAADNVPPAPNPPHAESL